MKIWLIWWLITSQPTVQLSRYPFCCLLRVSDVTKSTPQFTLVPVLPCFTCKCQSCETFGASQTIPRALPFWDVWENFVQNLHVSPASTYFSNCCLLEIAECGDLGSRTHPNESRCNKLEREARSLCCWVTQW